MMGGSVSHEYMLLTPAGEDSIAICGECDYKANMEAAESIIINNADMPMGDLEEIETPNVSTIEEVVKFVNLPITNMCKAVVYQKNSDDKYIIIFVRGDLEINEAKLTKIIGEKVHPAVITEQSGITAGFIGPIGLPANVEVIFDSSLKGIEYLVTGANKVDKHIKGFNIKRDCGDVDYKDVTKIIDGAICPKCGKNSISISRGIEVGNIFQLGIKYTKAMNMQYLDANGESQYPIMGCYGIGVGRTAASICEVHHDEYGPIWPITIAPWEVQLCCIRADDEETKNFSDALYEQLLSERIEVLYDDRDMRAGAMFADADLIGIPLRVVISPRNMKENLVEISSRDKKISLKVNKDDVISEIKGLIKQLYDEINQVVK